MNKKRLFEYFIHGVFLLLGLITVGCVLLITIYLVISGIPAIREIGLIDFLFGSKWAPTAGEPEYGILPFILTSIYGTAGAILLGVPIGFFTAVYLSKAAGKKVRTIIEAAVNLLAGIPSVVYGLVGMLVLVPAVRKFFDIPDGASLFAAIIVLAVMILPSIIKVSITALDAVPKEYEDASLALGATNIETYFKVSVPACEKQGEVQVIIKDTGIGIPVEHQSRIFERFYRVDKSHSKETGGTGLGLSIVKHAVAYHGGTIDLFSQVGKGTKITITF